MSPPSPIAGGSPGAGGPEPGPPRWLTLLFQTLLPDTPPVRAALGDLHEGWARRRRRHGLVRAHLWYVGHGLSLLRYRTPGEGLRPSPAGLRVSIRTLARKPLLPATALLTLAPALAGVGVGGALAWTALLRPLPHPDPDRLVVIEHTWAGFGTTGISSALHAFYEEQAGTLDRLGLVSWTGVAVTGTDGRATRVPAARVTAATLELLGARPLHGRLLLPVEDRGMMEGVILTHGLWVDRFGGDPGILGERVVVEGSSLEVVGVLQPGLEFPGGEARLVLPAAIQGDGTSLLDIEWWYALGRLAPGADPTDAGAELGRLLERAVQEVHDGSTTRAVLDSNGIAPVVTRLDHWVAGKARDFVVLLGTTVTLLFLLALAALLNVVLGRSEARRDELSIRRVLGAGEGRILGVLAVETSLVCGVAGFVGALGAWQTTRALLSTAALDLPRTGGTAPDVLAAGLAGLLALGLVPLLTLVALVHARGGAHGLAGSSGTRVTRGGLLRPTLLSGQVAVTTVLLVATLAMGASVRSLLQRPLGFEPDDVLTFVVSLPWATHPGWNETRAFHEEVGSRLAALPGVRSHGRADGLPVPSQSWSGAVLQVEGEPADGALPTYNWGHTSMGYLETLRIPLLAGRRFAASDMEERGHPVVVVNDAFARRHWSGPEDALGRRVHRSAEPWEIVGVVGNTAGDGAWGDLSAPMVYVPAAYSQWHLRDAVYAVRTEIPPAQLADEIRSVVASVDPSIPVFDVTTLEAAVEATRARERLALEGIGVSGLAALAVVATSLAGLLLLTILRRRREIGVRKAVGATDRGLRWELLRGVLVPTALGLAVGAGGVLGGLRVPASLLHGGADASAPLVPVGGAILAFVLAAGYLASRRIASIEPAEALRAE